MNKTSEIKITVELDEKNMPVKINWSATDAGFDGSRDAKTLMLSLWDPQEKLTLAIDLWTNDMMVADMYLHYQQIFQKMAETFQSSTNNLEAAEMIRKFAREFSKKLEEDKAV